MKIKKPLMLLIVLASLIIFADMPLAAPSASIMYQETALSGGSWQYNYTFNNTSVTGEYLYKVFLDFNQIATVTGSPLPTGWFGTVWDGSHTTTYLDAMGTNSTYYIAANNSLSGFSFTSNYQAGSIPFHAEFDDGAGKLFVTSGTTAVVPEPISTVLFLTGGTLLVVRNRWKRRRQIV